jgi:small-conductance mechanosensitive channel
LAASLRDLSQASGKLDNILMTAFAVVWGIIVCAAFGVDVGSQLLPLWTMFVAISFIFGNSAKDMFESIIFVFVTVSHLNL